MSFRGGLGTSAENLPAACTLLRIESFGSDGDLLNFVPVKK